ncbi:MAG: hypothetical protein ACPGF7_08895 [Pontibacterium sp.]
MAFGANDELLYVHTYYSIGCGFV